MKNLAGIPQNVSNLEIKIELEKAGILAVPVAFMKSVLPEVSSNLIGVLHFQNGTTVAFSRAWYYWKVHTNKPLPYAIAKELNTRFFTTVRVDGFAGGTGVENGGCSCWHVDTQEGLNELVRVLIETFGKLALESVPKVDEMSQMGLLDKAIYGS